jgi:hypothetical protein
MCRPIMPKIEIQQTMVKIELITKEDNMFLSLLKISTNLIQKIMNKGVTIIAGQDQEIIMNNQIKKII